MQSKWIGYSKIVIGCLVIIANSLIGLPFIPVEWQQPINAVVALLVAIDRWLGPKAALTLTFPRSS